MADSGETVASVKLAAATALLPLLSIFQEVDGSLLREVRQTTDSNNVITICLVFDCVALSIRAVPDDDTVDLSLCTVGESGERVSEQEPWRENIGKPVGWGWVTVNQQGYLDGVLLSFEGVVPEILVTVVASSLHVKRIV